MNIALPTSLIILLTLLSGPTWAQVSEMERLSGFAKHHNNNDRFDAARAQGERAQLEQAEQWENQRSRDLANYRKVRKPNRPDEEGAEAVADATAKRRYKEVQEKDLETYVQTKRKQQNLVREKFGLPTESQELGLDDTRPRYDYKKRAAFGATPKFGKSASSSGSGTPSRGSGGGAFGGGSSPSFPPPPTFDDFGGDGYVPAPNMPDDFGDIPPPPPPPPPPFDGDFGGSDFPPPPPPPAFGEGDF